MQRSGAGAFPEAPSPSPRLPGRVLPGSRVLSLPLPMSGPDLDGARRLAAAVFERAKRDMSGALLNGKAGRDAREWVQEAGPTFRFWCVVAGRDWRMARRELLRR